jgi:NhaA family Na+:H+ antiporter
VLYDLDAHLFEARVREDYLSGVGSGIAATPSFFINGVRFAGRWDEASLREALGGVALAGAAG